MARSHLGRHPRSLRHAAGYFASWLLVLGTASTTLWPGMAAGVRATPLPTQGSQNAEDVDEKQLFIREAKKACPGVEYLFTGNATNNITSMSTRTSPASCAAESLPNFSASPGLVYGVCGGRHLFCRLHVAVPEDERLRANVSFADEDCEGWRDTQALFYDTWNFSFPATQAGLIHYQECYSRLDGYHVASMTNRLYISYYNHPTIRIRFWPVTAPLLRVVRASSSRGHVAPVHPARMLYQRSIHVDLKVPRGLTTAISFRRNRFSRVSFGGFSRVRSEGDYVDVIASLTPAFFKSSSSSSSSSSSLRVFYRFVAYEGIRFTKTLFSFHPPNETLTRVNGSFAFNCSVDVYPRFRYHLECNQVAECEDGGDEGGHCPYSSAVCRGRVASRDKCFEVVQPPSKVTAVSARVECRDKGAELVSVKTGQERQDLLRVFRNTRDVQELVGYLGGWGAVPFMYRRMDRWADGTMIYNLHHLQAECCCDITVRLGAEFHRQGVKCLAQKVYTRLYTDLICERKVPSNLKSTSQKVEFPAQQHRWLRGNETKQSLVVRPHTGAAHSFLSCDPGAFRDGSSHPKFCTFTLPSSPYTRGFLHTDNTTYPLGWYACEDGVTTVPHSLVCDFRRDCPDNSDESFCQHPPCPGSACTNGQCVSTDRVCDEQPDCLDDSDEAFCRRGGGIKSSHLLKTPRDQTYLINLDGTGHFRYEKMESNQSCPGTHYRCAAELLYCLPIHTRCNGFYDCVYGEDEDDCQAATCPGLYLCRGSGSCVHSENLCDGLNHCPQKDDEWFCDVTCPPGCLCQALDFFCPRPFSPHLFPHLRYLDATGSEMPLSHMRHNTYLVHLSVAECSLYFLHAVKLLNLRFLDLSSNRLKTVSMDMFLSMPNLRVLVLGNNPLMSFSMQSLNQTHHTLRRVDLSRTLLEVLKKTDFEGFSQIRHLNVSFSAIHTIEHAAFQHLQHLVELDIRGNTVTGFPIDLFAGLSRLSTVRSSNYRLCCQRVIVQTRSRTKCLTAQATLSLCDNLLQSDLYRAVWWLVFMTALLGNSVSLIAQCLAKKTFFMNSFVALMSNLNVANLCTGVYVGVIAVANEKFHEVYFLHESSWVKSPTCNITGFVFLLTTEASVLLVLVITVDHVVVLYCPFSAYRFNEGSTVTACVSIWLVSFSLASIFVPRMRSSEIQYGYDSLCHPGLLEWRNFTDESAWFSVIEIFNLVLFSLIGVGQCMIYRAIPKYRISAEPNKQVAFFSAHLSVKMAMPYAVCWISMTCVGLMDLVGVAESDMVHASTAVLVLSLHSAVNPVLYLWALATHRKQQSVEERVLKRLKTQYLFTKSNVS